MLTVGKGTQPVSIQGLLIGSVASEKSSTFLNFFQAPHRSNCALCAMLSFDAIAALRLHALSLVSLTIWIARLAVASVNAPLMALCRPIEKV